MPTRTLRSLAIGTLFTFAAACSNGSSGRASDQDVEVDAVTADADSTGDVDDGSSERDADADGSGAADLSEADVDEEVDVSAGEWERTYPAAAAMPAPEGALWARSIVHLHSTHSHDACDDTPRLEGGEYNEPCIESLRHALCDVRIDVAYITDHPTHMTEVPIEDLLLHQPTSDALARDELGRPVANVISCEGGHQVILRAGAEDSLMPIGLREHVDPDQPTRHEIMNDYTADAATRMREAGALVWVAHTEGRSAEDLAPLGIDGLEIYQLHANLDPNIRRDLLGLDPFGPIADLFPFISGTTDTPADLSVLAFLEPNEPSLTTWAKLLVDGPMVATGGTDAHENTFPGEASDGERMDSYRRMMSWFSNYLLIDGELTWESADAALRYGRVIVAFDVLGDPSGMDFALSSPSNGRVEVGESVSLESGMRLTGSVPALVGPSGIPAEVTTIVFFTSGDGWEEITRFGAGSIDVPITKAGAYRVEVRVTGAHLAPWTGGFDWATRTYPWIYTNAWRVGLGAQPTDG